MVNYGYYYTLFTRRDYRREGSTAVTSPPRSFVSSKLKSHHAVFPLRGAAQYVLLRPHSHFPLPSLLPFSLSRDQQARRSGCIGCVSYIAFYDNTAVLVYVRGRPGSGPSRFPPHSPGSVRSVHSSWPWKRSHSAHPHCSRSILSSCTCRWKCFHPDPCTFAHRSAMLRNCAELEATKN
jgi:hypothetical protein